MQSTNEYFYYYEKIDKLEYKSVLFNKQNGNSYATLVVKKNSQNINYEEEFEKWGIKYIQL